MSLFLPFAGAFAAFVGVYFVLSLALEFLHFNFPSTQNSITQDPEFAAVGCGVVSLFFAAAVFFWLL